MGLTQATRGTHINQPLCLRWAISHPRVPFKWKQKRPKPARTASQAQGPDLLPPQRRHSQVLGGLRYGASPPSPLRPGPEGWPGGRGHGCTSPARGVAGTGSPQTLSGPADQVSLQPSELRLPTRDLAGFPPNPLTSMFH